MTCQCRFTDCNKCPTPVEDADIGGGCACGEQVVDGNSLCFPLNFAVRPKNALKNSL